MWLRSRLLRALRQLGLELSPLAHWLLLRVRGLLARVLRERGLLTRVLPLLRWIKLSEHALLSLLLRLRLLVLHGLGGVAVPRLGRGRAGCLLGAASLRHALLVAGELLVTEPSDCVVVGLR